MATDEERRSSVDRRKYILLCCCYRTNLAKRHPSKTDLCFAPAILSATATNTYYLFFAVSPIVMVREHSIYGLHLFCPITPNFKASSSGHRYNGRPKTCLVVFITTEVATYTASLVVPSSISRLDRLPVLNMNTFTQ